MLQVGIAGCGVAGLAAASLLARDGAKVVVFDRMHEAQPIGSGLILQPVGLAVLREIGIGEAELALGAPIRRLFGKVQPSGKVVLDVRYAALGKDKPSGLAVLRGTLFDWLYRAAIRAGVEIVPGKEIVGADARRLKFADGSTSAAFDLVIDALGVKSPISRPEGLAPLPFGALWANLDWAEGFDPEALEQRYETARKMVGVLPVGRLKPGESRKAAFFWSLRQRDFADWKKRDIGAWKEDVLALWPETRGLVGQIKAHEDLIFASYAHGTLKPVSNGVLHAGDSWHCASPQLGQGANMALLDALAIRESVRAGDGVADMLARYSGMRRAHIALYQLASWMFTPAYQSDGQVMPFIRDWVLSPVARIWPAPVILAGLVSGAIGSPLRTIARAALRE
jgi:2-polyprenyl-6-methoxyphenol hydroxylase-like FAD-dependent oxidoreductase